MKLTESRIKEIIKEEITRISEQEDVSEETAESVEQIISKISDPDEKLIVQNYIVFLKQKAGIN